MRNAVLKNAISRDVFTLLLSKMYYANPKRQKNSSKTYCIDDVSCVKEKYAAARSLCSCLNIEKTMAKFKGGSTLKQYMPLKLVKWGIKLYEICDS